MEEAQQVAEMITDADQPLLILGGGSNLLLTGDYNGTVLHSGIRFLEQTDECHVRCGSGFIWDDVVDYCVANNLYGAENLSTFQERWVPVPYKTLAHTAQKPKT